MNPRKRPNYRPVDIVDSIRLHFIPKSRESKIDRFELPICVWCHIQIKKAKPEMRNRKTRNEFAENKFVPCLGTSMLLLEYGRTICEPANPKMKHQH